MNKKGNTEDLFRQYNKTKKTIKQSYLYRLVSSFLSTVCSIVLVILLIVGAFMFYFNMKSRSYTNKGLEYTAPFGLYTIVSGSMEPNVSVYDVVIAADYDISKIKVGDIITFVSSWDINYGVTVTHRVVAIDKNERGEFELSTKGDNNGSVDGGKVTQHNLVGKVVGRLPQLGRLQFFLATKMGWFIVIFIPALAVIIFDMIKIFKLYVLKNQIDNIKSSSEIEKSAIPKREPEKKVILSEIESQEIIDNGDETVDDSIIEDEKVIDTVELPKITENGIITDGTAELPLIKPKEEQSIVQEENVLPKLNSENIDRHNNQNEQKKMLTRPKR